MSVDYAQNRTKTRTHYQLKCRASQPSHVAPQNSRSVSELLAGGSIALQALKSRTLERSVVLQQVCAALPARLAEAVASAGIEGDRLTVGATGAVWASRLRYQTENLRRRVGESMGMDIRSVRIRVVPPSPPHRS